MARPRLRFSLLAGLWLGTSSVVLPVAAVEPALEGEVASVDLGRRSLTVKVKSAGESREVDLLLGDPSRIVSGGRTLTLDQVRSGERVSARCGSADRDGRRVCEIRVRPRWPSRVSSIGGPPAKLLA